MGYKNNVSLIMGTKYGITYRAQVYHLAYGLDPKGEKNTVTMYFFVIPIDENGNEINSPSVKKYQWQNVADDTTIVKIEDGTIINTAAKDYQFDENTMIGQGSFFAMIADTQPAVVNDYLRKFLQQSKDLGKWGMPL